jgi:hypothetical protein
VSFAVTSFTVTSFAVTSFAVTSFHGDDVIACDELRGND